MTELPLPFKQASEAQAMRAMFGVAGPTDRTPLGAAYLWFQAVLDLEAPQAVRDARMLSYDPAVWGDYREIARRMRGWSIMQNVEQPETGEPDVAHVKLLHVDFVAQAFADAPIPPSDLQWLTLTTHDTARDRWRVWSLSPGDYRPSAGRVLRGEQQ